MGSFCQHLIRSFPYQFRHLRTSKTIADRFQLCNNGIECSFRNDQKRYRGEVATGGGRQTDLSGLGPKRFYDRVNVEQQQDGTHAVTLDGKPVRTAGGGWLRAPTMAFATALAEEWDAQQDRLRPSSMPLTRIVGTARDAVPIHRSKIRSDLLKFLDTDTVCIRPAHPSELVQRQDDVFEPILRHMAARGASLNIVRGQLFTKQTKQCWDYVTKVVSQLDDYSLAAMDSAASTAKSLSVAIALRDGILNPVQALSAARSEEQWQAAVWGVVEGGHDMDDADGLVRLSAAHTVFRFVDLDPKAFQSASSNTETN